MRCAYTDWHGDGRLRVDRVMRCTGIEGKDMGWKPMLLLPCGFSLRFPLFVDSKK
jgi:hypothetical protein